MSRPFKQQVPRDAKYIRGFRSLIGNMGRESSVTVNLRLPREMYDEIMRLAVIHGRKPKHSRFDGRFSDFSRMCLQRGLEYFKDAEYAGEPALPKRKEKESFVRDSEPKRNWVHSPSCPCPLCEGK